MFTGFSYVVDINIPFKLSNHANWHKQINMPVIEMGVSKDFELLFENELSQPRPGLISIYYHDVSFYWNW